MSDTIAAGAVRYRKPEGAPARKFHFDERYFPPVLITLILLVGQLSFHFLEGFEKTALAITVSILTELALGRFTTGKWPHLASAYISGISVGILVRSPFLWPYVLCAAISITSKYAIRIQGRHIWNPSNLGIVCMLLLAPSYFSTLSIQWDNSILPMLVIWTIGSFIIYRLKRFHICATYAICFVSYAFIRHLITKDTFLAEVAPITGPMYQLFTFFMITDPKTTVKSKKGQIFVTFLIATLENFLRLYGNEMVASHAPYFALTLIGPAANLIEIYTNPRKKTSLPGAPMNAVAPARP